MSYEEFSKLGFTETLIKLGSIPEDEPLYKIIKSRTINVNKIKDKNERKYWRELRRINKIPDIYLSDQEVYSNLRAQIKQNKL